MSTEHMDESAYLELKGMIIDWAEGRAVVFPSLEHQGGIESKEMIIMLKRVIKEIEEK